MSGDKFAKQQAGQPLEIPAATWNAMLDAARAHVDQQHDQSVQDNAWFRSGDLIKVRNQSGQDLDRFAVLGLQSPIIQPAGKLREFKNQVAINGVLPAGESFGRFCILLDPLKKDKIGRAWVSGVCPVQIEVEQDWHRYADISPGSGTELKSKPDGAAEILWREPGTGVKWAVVRLSNAHRTRYLAKVPGGGIPARVGTQTGSAECELHTVGASGEIEPVTRPEGETVQVRWIRAGVGGGFIGLLISTTFVFVNDAKQLPWMASTIVVGSLLGVLIELVAPWASGTKDQFLRLVEVLWPESTVLSWRHEGITVYQYDIPGSIETELGRFRTFFDAIEKLDWKLAFEQDLNRSYKRNGVRMEINLEPLDHHVVMRLAVLRGTYASQASPNLSPPASEH